MNKLKKVNKGSAENKAALPHFIDGQYMGGGARAAAYYAMTKKGASHAVSGKECQDYSYACPGFAVVADGHGGSKHPYSAEGARLACEVMLKLYGELCAAKPKRDRLLKFCRSILFKELIVTRWQQKADELHRQKTGMAAQPADRILYGSTLLFAFSLEDVLVVGQLGDGGILLLGDSLSDSTVFQDTVKCGEDTASLCMDNAQLYLKVGIYDTAKASALFLFCDGVFDTFHAFADLYDFWQRMEELLQDTGGNKAEQVLESALKTVSECSDDDLSVAALRLKGGYTARIPLPVDRTMCAETGAEQFTVFRGETLLFYLRPEVKPVLYCMSAISYDGSRLFFSEDTGACLFREYPGSDYLPLDVDTAVLQRTRANRMRIAAAVLQLTIRANERGIYLNALHPQYLFINEEGEVLWYDTASFQSGRALYKDKYNYQSDYYAPLSSTCRQEYMLSALLLRLLYRTPVLRGCRSVREGLEKAVVAAAPQNIPYGPPGTLEELLLDVVAERKTATLEQLLARLQQEQEAVL